MHIIKYSTLPGLERTGVLAPMLGITFKSRCYEFPTVALVDSGAEQAAISTVIADALHINWRKIPRKVGLATSGNFPFHPIQDMYAKIYDYEFRLNVNVVEGINAFKCILGRRDFFKHATIIFEGFRDQFKIEFRELN